MRKREGIVDRPLNNGPQKVCYVSWKRIWHFDSFIRTFKLVNVGGKDST